MDISFSIYDYIKAFVFFFHKTTNHSFLSREQYKCAVPNTLLDSTKFTNIVLTIKSKLNFTRLYLYNVNITIYIYVCMIKKITKHSEGDKLGKYGKSLQYCSFN